MHTYHSFLTFDIIVDWYFFASLSLSFFWIVYAWHPIAKLLYPETLFVPRHLLLLILLLFTFSFVMRRLIRTSWRTFLDVAFIQNSRSFFQTSLILIYPLSLTVGVGNPFVISWSAVPPWSYRSFTPICTDLITPYLAFSLLFEVYVLSSLRSLSPMCYTSQGYHILITLVILVCKLCPKVNSCLSFVKHLLLGLCKRFEAPKYSDEICFTSLVSL